MNPDADITNELARGTFTDELLANNKTYVASFDKGDLPMPPGKNVAVVACMDARLNVYGALGLHEGTVAAKAMIVPRVD